MVHTWSEKFTTFDKELTISRKRYTQQTHISLFVKGKDVVRALSNGDISDDLALRELPEITHSLGFYTFLRISEAPEARNFEFCTRYRPRQVLAMTSYP